MISTSSTTRLPVRRLSSVAPSSFLPAVELGYGVILDNVAGIKELVNRNRGKVVLAQKVKNNNKSTIGIFFKV